MTAEKEILIWAKALYSLLEEKTPKERRAIAERLAGILQRKRKAYLLPKIIRKLEMISLRENKVDLFLAMNHSASMVREIKEKLSKMVGKEKNIEVKIEKDLIGGFRAKTSNLLVKASVRDFLEEIFRRSDLLTLR